MKKIISTLLAGAALMGITSCADSEYDDKYPDPSKTTTVAVSNVFTGVMQAGNTYMNPIYYRYYIQMSTSGIFSGVLGDNNTQGRFMGAGIGRYDDRWKDFYKMVTQLRLLEYNYNNLGDSEKENNKIFLHLGRVLVDAQLHEMLSLFGDVPFNGAGTLWIDGKYDEAKAKCTYDDDVVLYKQILSELKEAADYFAGEMNSIGLMALGRQDYTIAAGNETIWRKYINSLRLRIALHLATTGDCVSEAHNTIAEILNNPSQYPVIDNNDENMGVTADTQSDTFNFGKSLSQALHGNNGASQSLLNVMNVPANGIPDANTDPRLQAMYDPNFEGQYIAYDVRKTNSEITKISDEKSTEYTLAGARVSNYYNKIDSTAVAGWAEYQGNEKLFGVWISAAEVSLSKAEAYLMGYGVAANADLAKSNFITGVKQSCEYYWNQKLGSTLYTEEGNDAYYGYRPLIQPTDDEIAAYAEKIWKPTQEAVCSQLWLNFAYHNLLEAWNVVRRTGYPEITFAQDALITSYPTPPNRLPYPNDEQTYNAQNYQDAVAKNYDEPLGYYTNLFWAKKDYFKIIATN